MVIPAGGGGSISVEPAALEAMAAQIMTVSTGTSSARGGLAAAAVAAAGCQQPAAGSFALLQKMLDSALGTLDIAASALSRTTSSAATAYAVTDATQFP
jgi:uncharacterized protein YukE